MTTDDQWYKDAIFYELQVKSFYDSNADGIGDFRGLVEKLDYLKDLGVDCIWVTPFFPSPLKDDGYDIADFIAVVLERRREEGCHPDAVDPQILQVVELLH